MERRIHELPEVNAATLTFATKQLRVAVTAVAADDTDKLLAKFQDICSSIEPEVIVSRQAASQKGKKALQPTASKEAAQKSRKQKIGLISILTGAVLFILGEVLEQAGIGASFLPPLIFVLAYLILGSEILAAAGKNIVRGQVFDENFLMGIATLGAFAIGNFPEAVGVMLFYRIGEYFEEAAVSRSRSQIMDAVDLRPEVVNLVVGDGTKTIPAEEAQPGDLLFIRPGDRIPLDGVITEGESRLDTSPITGEPVPIRASAGDPVTSGCINLSGSLSIRVEKNLEHSMVTRILENAAASKPKIDRFITRFSRIYTPFVVAAAFATAILPSLVTGDWRHWIYTALTFLVISCPCALVLSVPLAFFSGIGSGSKRGILFKVGVSIEALGRISTVIMDKTGTVTKGDFALQKVTPFHGYEEEEILTLCASCEQQSTHPIGVSITAAAREKGLALEQTASLEEIAGQGICATLSAGKVLAGNRKLMERFQIDTSGCSQSSFGAQAVAEATGIDEVHAKLLPEGKLSKLQEIRKEHGAAMFVGDGINDAPVLAGADVGAAMGSGADAAIEAADVVFMTSNMEAVPDSITIAKATTRIAWQNVVFALGIKAVVMALGLTGYASMWMAVFADSGVAMLCVLNSIRLLYKK